LLTFVEVYILISTVSLPPGACNARRLDHQRRMGDYWWPTTGAVPDPRWMYRIQRPCDSLCSYRTAASSWCGDHLVYGRQLLHGATSILPAVRAASASRRLGGDMRLYALLTGTTIWYFFT